MRTKLFNLLCTLFCHLQEEKQKAYRRDKRKDRKRKADDSGEGTSGMDPDMAAIMGFAGFGGSAKK